MKIAVTSTKPGLDGIVPDTFETAPALLVIETDNGSICSCDVSPRPMDYVDRIVRERLEAVVCGEHIGKECFNPIADACVTRYNGAGLNVLDAAVKADRNRLPIIPEYEGGPGCSAGTGNCEDGSCGHSH